MQENQQDDYLILNMDVEELINVFLHQYFSDIHHIIDFNINFIEHNSFSYKTDIDYIRLERFVATTYNTMIKIDPSFNYTLLSKFNKDIETLNKIYKQFIKKYQDISQLYSKQFLIFYNGIENIAKTLKTSNEGLEIFENIKELNEFIKEDFYKLINQEIASYKKSFKKIINTKYYYFDHLLYYEAKKSDSIKAYYRDSLGKNVLSTKLYIERYLKNINKDNSNHDKINNYLSKIVHIMDY